MKKDKDTNQRRHERLKVQIPVLVYRADNMSEPLACQIVDISRGGAMIKSRDPSLSVGQKVVLEIRYNDGYFLKGTVRRVENVEIVLDENDQRQEWADGQGGFLRVEFAELPTQRDRAFAQMLKELEISLQQNRDRKTG